MPFYPLNNFEIQSCYQNDPKFDGGYSINNLPKIKDWIYIYNKSWRAEVNRNSLDNFVCE